MNSGVSRQALGDGRTIEINYDAPVPKAGARLLSRKSIRPVAEELLEIGARAGVGDVGLLKAEDVVQASRNKKSALHPYFKWGDDKAAAHQYRLDVARTLIREVTFSVRLVSANQEVQMYDGPVFRNIVDGDGRRGYLALDKTLSDEGMRAQMIKKASDALDEWMIRHARVLGIEEPARAFVDGLKGLLAK